MWRPGAHAGTFRGNQLAMAAGSATLRVIQHQRLDAAAADMGARLMQRLLQLKAEHACVGDVRGRGLMVVGMELVRPSHSQQRAGLDAAPELASRVQQECLRQGLISELGGRHGSVVRLLPPLIITPPQLGAISCATGSGGDVKRRRRGETC